MVGLLQAAKILLIALATMLVVFSLNMLFGASMHAHDMGFGKLAASAGLGMLAGFLGGLAALSVTIFRRKSTELPRLKRLNMILLVIVVLLIAVSVMSVFPGPRRSLTNLLT
jgi:hypothetical protein